MAEICKQQHFETDSIYAYITNDQNNSSVYKASQ